jgi:subtilisin family serine protease
LPKYLRLTGTSMSAGVTSGVVALMLEASRAAQLAPNAVKAILQFTAIPLDGADTLSQGAGGLNALGAVRLASAIDASIPEGAWWLRSTMAPVDMIAGAPVSWAERIIWGDDLDESVVWSNRIIWGTLASSPLQVTHVLID